MSREATAQFQARPHLSQPLVTASKHDGVRARIPTLEDRTSLYIATDATANDVDAVDPMAS